MFLVSRLTSDFLISLKPFKSFLLVQFPAGISRLLPTQDLHIVYKKVMSILHWRNLFFYIFPLCIICFHRGKCKKKIASMHYCHYLLVDYEGLGSSSVSKFLQGTVRDFSILIRFHGNSGIYNITGLFPCNMSLINQCMNDNSNFLLQFLTKKTST